MATDTYKQTLYHKLILLGAQSETDKEKELIYEHSQRNPILNDAVLQKQSLEDTLFKLNKINNGIRKYLPRRKNSEHNKKVSYMSEIVPMPESFYTKGLFALDNFFNGILIISGIFYCTGYFIGNAIANNKEFIRYMFEYMDLQDIARYYKITMPGYTSLVAGPIIALTMQSKRTGNIPLSQARYIDEKIKELFH